MKTTKKIINQKGFSIIIALFLAGIIIMSSLFINKKNEKVEAQGMTTPFGGTIQQVTYCCDGSVLLQMQFVGNSGGGDKILYSTSSSTLYANYNVWTSGPWLLGTYRQGGSCQTISSECESSENGSTIEMIGTSSF